MKVVVTGGAGFIGSHMVKALLREKWEVVTIDNLSTGHRDAVVGGVFVQHDLAQRTNLVDILRQSRAQAVFHFAGLIQVGESARDPEIYYRNNVVGTLNLLAAMRETGIRQLVFSSTAAVYGEPRTVPIEEDHPFAPSSPYGSSKAMVEIVLTEYDRAYGLRSVSLRYFNAAGADPEGNLSERHEPESHLIPLALQVARGCRRELNVFGTDYDTPDGTCVRDYVHVSDLCDAHLAALDWLSRNDSSGAFNLGNGRGYSVRDVVRIAEEVSGRPIPTVDLPRRLGDPARLVASASRALDQLNWQPKFGELKTIIEHAWASSRRATF